MAYSRVFIALKQGCQDYAKDVRGSVGRCIIELRNGAGRLLLQVQGLRCDCDYRVCIMSKDNYAEVSRPLYVDATGKGEVKWEFYPKDIGIDVSDIKAVAVLVRDKAPLIGFVEGEYNWQHCLMAKDIKDTQVKASDTGVNKVEVAVCKDDKKEDIKDAKCDNISSENESTEKEKLIYIINEFEKDFEEINKYSKIGTADGENYIFSKEAVKPFGDDNILWVNANIKELCLIKALWKYINNPFVIKGCRDYKHILLGKSDKNYYLAVPEKYDRGYKLEAMAQGFNEIKTDGNKPLKQGELCYYILIC